VVAGRTVRRYGVAPVTKAGQVKHVCFSGLRFHGAVEFRPAIDAIVGIPRSVADAR
jgi:hypothetical protein